MGKILTIPRNPDAPNPEDICRGCDREVDYTTCCCGTSKDYHGSPMSEGHSFVPMGCECGYA